MAKNAKVNYDYENDILYVFVGNRAKDSLEIDNFVIDFSHENKVVGVEIFNASELISKLVLSKISKDMLSNIKEASLSFYQSKELFYIVVGLVMMIENKLKEIPIQVPAPRLAITVQS
jgi:uncharacterized protein YuzE